MSTSANRLVQRHKLLSFLHQALASLADQGALERPLVVHAHNHQNEGALAVAARGHAASQPGSQEFPGRFFSDLEAAVWNTLCGKVGLSGKQIAKAIGRKGFDSELKCILRNLVRRGCLMHSREQGFSRVHRKPASE